MTNWYTGAGGSAHEFGHMIGNLDEYNAPGSHYLAVVGSLTAAGTQSSQDPTGTTMYWNNVSIMGQGGTVQLRHLDHLRDWLNEHRRKDVRGRFIEPRYRLVPGP